MYTKETYTYIYIYICLYAYLCTPNTFSVFPCLTLFPHPNNPWRGHYNHPRFTDEKTKAGEAEMEPSLPTTLPLTQCPSTQPVLSTHLKTAKSTQSDNSSETVSSYK